MTKRLKNLTADLDVQIGARIRDFRLRRSMSQEVLAAKIAITFQQLQKYEKGVNRVSCSALILICKSLGITANDILGPFFDGEKDSTLIPELLEEIAQRDRKLSAIQSVIAEKPDAGEKRRYATRSRREAARAGG